MLKRLHHMESRDQSQSLPYQQDILHMRVHARRRKSRRGIVHTLSTDQHLYQQCPLHSSCMTWPTQQHMCHWSMPHMLWMVHYLGPQYQQHTECTGPQQLTSTILQCTRHKVSKDRSPGRLRQQDSQSKLVQTVPSTAPGCSRCTV